MIPGLLLSAAVGVGAWWVARRLFRHAREIEGHRAEAERANRAKSVLLANISHELRTPLTAIIGFAEIAFAPGADAGERADAMATVRHNADHLLTLINDLLDMSSVEAGAMSIEPVEVDARELVRTTVAPLRLRARQKAITLEVRGEEHLPDRAVLDPTRTRQILLNLLSNAVKFTEAGHVRLHIEPRPGAIRFRIEDTGPGLDESQIARLFQPFSQVGGSHAKRREGTGLGLAISQHLARLMGAQITVESTPGVGSVFTVEIPFEPVRSPEAASRASGPGEPSLAGRRILVAEDGADNRRLLRFILTKAGAEVQEYPDGWAALEAVRAADRPFDLVLTDWDMPRLDGAGLVAALRAAGWTGPVVSLTAHALDGQERVCLDAGCDAHLTKPIDWAKLVDTCERLIGTHGHAGQGQRAA
jgi:CheY-like chemotaxis protein/nitrogen-specific signal transduction histidine kinase